MQTTCHHQEAFPPFHHKPADLQLRLRGSASSSTAPPRITLKPPRVAGDEQPSSHLLPPPYLLLVGRRETRRRAAGVHAGPRRELQGTVEFQSARVRARRGREGGRRGSEEGVHARGELGLGEVTVRDAWYDPVLTGR